MFVCKKLHLSCRDIPEADFRLIFRQNKCYNSEKFYFSGRNAYICVCKVIRFIKIVGF